MIKSSERDYRKNGMENYFNEILGRKQKLQKELKNNLMNNFVVFIPPCLF